MAGKSLVAAIVVVFITVAAVLRFGDRYPSHPEVIEGPRSPRIEAAPMCPWREPEVDRLAFFPGSTRLQKETRILSHQRVDLAANLGRPVAADENALHRFLIFAEQELLGTILTRRIKGEYGGIEIVLAVDTNAAVCGLRFQRAREPDPVMQALESPGWLAALKGKRAHDNWELGRGVPDLPDEARESGRQITDGVRSLLILLEASENSGVLPKRPHHQ